MRAHPLASTPPRTFPVLAALGAVLLLGGCGINVGNRNTMASPNSFFPLAMGNTWTYELKALGNFPPCTDGTYSRRVTAQTTLDGKPAFTLSELCANDGETQLATNGESVEERYLDHWETALPSPLSNGLTWTDGSKKFVAFSVPSVTVKAGTFAECWRREWTQWFNAYTVFCRGAGPVVVHFEDAATNGYDARLVRKSF